MKIHIKRLILFFILTVFCAGITLVMNSYKAFAAPKSNSVKTKSSKSKESSSKSSKHKSSGRKKSKNRRSNSNASNSKSSVSKDSTEKSSGSRPPYLNARSAVAIDVKTKCVLYEQNAEELVAIASTTKILSCLVAIKYGDLDKKVVISEKAAKIHGSTVGYKAGESVSIRELLYGLMLRSGNDAAIAVAEGVSGSVEEFVKLMNEYALQIGVLNSHFDVPHGLDNPTHYSSAYDLGLITAKAKEEGEFNKIVSCKEVVASDLGFTRSYRNINKILWLLPNADGVKTGYTGDAGKCLVTSVKVDNRDVVIVVLNCASRWKETARVANYVENNYTYQKLYSKGDIVKTFYCEGIKDSINMTVKEDVIVPINKSSSFDIKINENKNLIGNVIEYDKVGNFEVRQGDKVIYRDMLYSHSKAGKKGLFK